MAEPSRFIEVPGGTIHARIEGEPDRPWLTALHALATDLHLWDGQMADWLARFRVLRLDMRGHGRSPPGNPPPERIESLAADVAAVWDALDIDSSVLIGLSIGGMIALEAGLATPERISGIVAVDCRADAPEPFRAMWDQRRALLATQGMEAVADATLPTWFTPETLAHSPAKVAQIRGTITATSSEGYVSATRALQQLAIRPRLSQLAVPLLYVVGDRDGAHPQAMAEMAAATPGARLETLGDAAHLSNVEQPAAFAAATLPFLDEVARRATPARA